MSRPGARRRDAPRGRRTIWGVFVPPVCLAIALLMTLAVYRGEASPRIRRSRKSGHATGHATTSASDSTSTSSSSVLDTEQTAAIGRLVDEREGQVSIAVDDLPT